AGAPGRHFYVRQLRDMKLKPRVEQFTPATLLQYAQFCGWALAHAHARSGQPALISGYLGKGGRFDEAVAEFSVAYADQSERDYRTLYEAAQNGRSEVRSEGEFTPCDMDQPMSSAHILDLLPLWGVFFVTFLLVFTSEESGFRFGRRRIRSEEETKDPSMGSMVGATLGLLAFMLAFTFGMASARYDTRRQLIRDEANAIHTAYLRADFVSEPRRTEIQRLLREYVDVRLAGIRQPD